MFTYVCVASVTVTNRGAGMFQVVFTTDEPIDRLSRLMVAQKNVLEILRQRRKPSAGRQMEELTDCFFISWQEIRED